jgi:hypothetical protein
MRNTGTVLNALRGDSAVLSARSSRRNRRRASCWETSPRGSDLGLFIRKGPAFGGHLASGLPVYRSSDGMWQDRLPGVASRPL